ncbi:MAG: reverse gyrase, partial [Dictyoglomus sp.]
RRNGYEEDKVKELQEKIREISKKAKGIMVVSSATSNPKSDRIRLFKELLSFDVGRPVFYLRNVEDVYEEVVDVNQSLLEKVKRFGKGGLVFLSSDYGKEQVEKIRSLLLEKGISAESYENLTSEVLDKYKKGEIQVLIGISSYRNPLARGLDLPEAIRYAIFYGVPKIVVNLDLEGNVKHLLMAIASIRPVIARDKNLEKYVRDIDKWLKTLNRLSIQANPPKEKIEELRNKIKDFILSPEIYEKIKTSDDIAIREEDGKWTLVVSDITGYLQASGRTSRLFAGGISKGLSYLLVDDKKVFNNLVRKSRWWFSSDITFKEASTVNLEEIFKEIDLDREKIKRKEGRRDDFLKPVLVIVESPHKARTIANFFGRPISRNVNGQELYEVITEDKYLVITASLGHILDLNKEVGYYGVLENVRFVPVYEPIEGKEKIISGIRDASKEFDLILIATDPDTEGEKIAWDLKSICAPYSKEIRRMEFHEVTRRAILNSLRESRDVNEDLVKAQVVRRISDRWVGFELSQLIQKVFSKNYLSAGRVQTPVLGWVIERAKENKKRIFLVVIRRDGLDLRFEFEDKENAQKFFDKLSKIYIIREREKVEEKVPPPPYTTDVILKDASDKYKLSVSRIMEILQELFERGFITYHRTDSTRVSETGINLAREYIVEQFGEEYFKGRTWSEGGAHECIRPTRVLDVEDIKSMIYSGELEGFTGDHLKIYDLIFKRFIASQMRGVILRGYDLLVKALDKEQKLEVFEEVIQDGFDKIYPLKLLKLVEGEIEVMNNKFFYSIPKAPLFTQGSLVEEMKKRGLGRPSTYATIVSRLLERGYVIEKNGYLIPTPLGEKVYSYLNSNEERFRFVKEDFTRELEELMDKVERGEEDFQEILRSLRDELRKN